LGNVLLSIIVFSVAALLARWLSSASSHLYILDHPNERSLHTRPTPRTGGLAIVVAVILGIALSAASGFSVTIVAWLVGALAIVVAVSYVDDRYGVAPFYRLLAHFAASFVLFYSGLSMGATGLQAAGEGIPAGLNAALTALFVVWMVNLYNFMDGMDGFAGGMAVIGFGSLAMLGWFAGHPAFVMVSVIAASAAGGFLISNFPPARIFMGDVGSSTLGLLAAGLLLWGARDGVFSIWVGLLVFSPFIVDATMTLLRRILRGERVWEAHKTHYYQRLVQLGWGHRKTVLWEYALMAACAASALWVVSKPPAIQYFVILGWLTGYAILMMLVARLEKQQGRQ
jgi:UDP-N-acetylmuramyl pentapeptide phosphotransferase/UDP-N-acetylglucosamine-1-phosphate transferase